MPAKSWAPPGSPQREFLDAQTPAFLASREATGANSTAPFFGFLFEEWFTRFPYFLTDDELATTPHRQPTADEIQREEVLVNKRKEVRVTFPDLGSFVQVIIIISLENTLLATQWAC